jgi:NAD(P)H-dependent FMN reductase
MHSDPLHIALIIGSTREGRFGITVAEWVADVIEARADVSLDVIDLATADLPHVWTRDPVPELVAYWSRIDRADAFVVVTPEYNHSYPAPLKQAIDLSRGEFARKPVAFVSYGGLSGGLRAVEHLRPVFAEVHAATIREAVSFHGAWERFDADGRPIDPAAAAAAEVMLDDLAWWATALRSGRQADVAATA